MIPSTSSLVSLGGLRLNLTSWGRADMPPLLLLHGLASTSHMFDLIAPSLAAKYYVLTVDQRGHGLSDKPDSGYDFETIATDIDQLLAHIGIGEVPITLGGHSWGAYTTLHYTATRPQRVKKAVLIDGGLRPVADFFKSLDAMQPPQHHGQSIDDIKRMIRENWLHNAFRPELEPLALSIFDTSNPHDVQPHLKLANHMQIARALWNFYPLDYLVRVKVPLLAVLGMDESPNPRMLAYIESAQESNKYLKVEWMPDTIHDIPWHRPHELLALMQPFLKD